MPSDRYYTLSASCPDQVGIIAKVSGFIAGNGGWILESSFHSDVLTARYFMRIEIKADSLPCLLAEFRERFRTEVAERLQMTWRINDSAVKKRVVILVSKQEHCLYDLLARHVAQDFPFVIPCVISNHEDHRKVVEAHGIPFHFLPVTPETKQAAYRKMEQLFRDVYHDPVPPANLAVLARRTEG